MKDDAALLREYAQTGSEPAFAELVRRHADLVYAAALRRTDGDAHRAADITQQVFVTLARKAALLRIEVLGAWLHTATRNAALNVMISERRRHNRELAAAALEPAAAGGVEWEQVRPVLDEAIDDLPEPDRVALVLRFLEQKPFAAIGKVLRVSEDAARMRIDRALDKLRVELGRRGITSTAAAIAAVVAAEPLVAAPAPLVSTLASQALAAAGGASAAGAIASLSKLYLWGAAAVLVVGISAVGFRMAAASSAPAIPKPDPWVAEAGNAPPMPAATPDQAKAATAGESRAPSPPWTVSDLAREANLALAAGKRDYLGGAKAFGIAGCALCHHFMGAGQGGIGPDLTPVGQKMGPRELLESIIEPSASISDLFGTVIVTTADGRRRAGYPMNMIGTTFELIAAPTLNPATGTMTWSGGVVISIPAADVVSVGKSGISSMPVGTIDILSKEEVFDLLAFLLSGGDPDDRMFKKAP